MKGVLYVFLLVGVVFFTSCEPEPVPVIMEGMAAIYADVKDYSAIASGPAREIGELGKIVNVGNTLYINELYQGIHVIDNSDPVDPIFTHFLTILGNTDFTIQGTTLYADNGVDLIVIDISDIENIDVVDVIEDQYSGIEDPFQYRPPNYRGVFDCVNLDEGFVVGWELRTLTNPACFAN